MTNWLLSTVGKRGYIADWLREASGGRSDHTKIVGTGSDPMTSGFSACDVAEIVPAYHQPDYAEHVLEVVRRHRIEAILSFADPDVATLSAIRSELSALGARCFFPGAEATDVAFDKMSTFRRARELAVPVPATALDRSDPSLSASVVMKPRTGSASSDVFFLTSDDPTPAVSSEPIFQSRLSGAEINTEVLCDLEGHVVRSSAWRKVKSRYGETELAVTSECDDALALASVMAENLPLVGPADFDWIIVEGVPHLIEINARFGGGYPVSHLAGAGFIEALVSLAQDEPVTPERLYRSGVFMMKELRPIGGLLEDAPELLHWSGHVSDPWGGQP